MRQFTLLIIFYLFNFVYTVLGQTLSIKGNLDLTGYNSITIPHDIIDFKMNSSFTIFLKLKLGGSQQDFAGIISKANPRNPMKGFQLCLVKNCLCLEYANNSDRYVIRMISSNSLNDGDWHNVVLVIDREASKAIFWIDGVLDKSLTDSHISDNISNTLPFTIGVERGGESYFSGFIRSIQIYDSALSYKEIERIE